MKAIEWTDPARADLRSIRAYIARDSPQYAKRLSVRIRKAVDGLRRFPEAGSLVSEWELDDVREIYVGNYRVIYRVRQNIIAILTVIHGARQLPDAPDS